MEDIFCKIINKEIAAEMVAEGEDWLAIKDIHPQAPVHVLIMPRRHVSSLREISREDEGLLGQLLFAVNKTAQKLGLAETGYRVIINQGQNGGQLVPHLHIHLLGGKVMGPNMVR